MEKGIIKELFEQPSKDFANHLELQDNHRIIFSGRYGIGKTTFLKHFFSAESNAKKPTGKHYNSVHLFPINYPVANNEDIFEYIKYDIIAHLLSVEEIEFEKIDISYLQSLPNFLLRRPADVIAPILHFFGGAGKAYENWQQLIKEFVKEHEDQQVDDKKVLLDFLEQMEKTSGGIYENDFYTELISKLLVQWKEAYIQEEEESQEDQESKIENVLIIDDLDRIDPAHIFRLFNVFAAHFDLDSHTNKFGFDKIIFVCDIENIRNIFHNNYGTHINFTGYIDKFYSKKVYDFINAPVLQKMLHEIVNAFSFEGNSYEESIRLKGDAELHKELEHILFVMIEADAVNLRALLKHHKKTLSLTKFRWIEITNSRTVRNKQLLITLILDALVEIFGNVFEIKIALEKCIKYSMANDINHTRNNEMVKNVIVLLAYKFGDQGEFTLEYSTNINFKVKYKLKDSDRIFAEAVQFLDENGEESLSVPNMFVMCLKALDLLESKGYFK